MNIERELDMERWKETNPLTQQLAEAKEIGKKYEDRYFDAVKDKERIDWLEMHMECSTTDGVSDQWVWREANLTNRDLRQAIDAAMNKEK